MAQDVEQAQDLEQPRDAQQAQELEPPQILDQACSRSRPVQSLAHNTRTGKMLRVLQVAHRHVE